MPNEEQLEYQITLARHDLEANLAELRMVVREKLDVRQRAREALARVKIRAMTLVTRNVMVLTAAAVVVGLLAFRRRHAAS